ncbi:MAG: TIGR01212 family radical SAM protein [Lachnospiraceae bacterium]|nr:TIGR01212 family radical SAM protein [Lachnospiraceae bacterium]
MGYYSFDKAMKEKYGGKVYRLSLSTGCTCPNRDGKCGTGGCIFCSGGGSGEFASLAVLPISKQIEAAKEKVASKLSSNFAGYIAYFQSFSNTYVHSNEERAHLEEIFTEAISYPEILGLAVATRPDCLSGEIVDMLKRLNGIKPVWVELGLQTSNDDTAGYINRGYRTEVYDEAVGRLHESGISVVTHVIVGLPGEDDKDAQETVRHIVSNSSEGDGVKITLLYLIEGTKLADMVKRGETVLHEYSLEEYAGVLKGLLDMLPEKMAVHRVTGDPPKASLISPRWTADKKKVLNYLNKML